MSVISRVFYKNVSSSFICADAVYIYRKLDISGITEYARLFQNEKPWLYPQPKDESACQSLDPALHTGFRHKEVSWFLFFAAKEPWKRERGDRSKLSDVRQTVTWESIHEHTYYISDDIKERMREAALASRFLKYSIVSFQGCLGKVKSWFQYESLTLIFFGLAVAGAQVSFVEETFSLLFFPINSRSSRALC